MRSPNRVVLALALTLLASALQGCGAVPTAPTVAPTSPYTSGARPAQPPGATSQPVAPTTR